MLKRPARASDLHRTSEISFDGLEPWCRNASIRRMSDFQTYLCGKYNYAHFTEILHYNKVQPFDAGNALFVNVNSADRL